MIMNIDEINNMEEDKYWEEATKYSRQRLDSEEGQKKLKNFINFQKEHIKAMKNYYKEYEKRSSELKSYITKGLEDTSDIFANDDFKELFLKEGYELFLQSKKLH